MDFVTPSIAEIAPSITLAVTAQAAKMKKEGIDVCSFGAGEPDMDTPAYIKDAAVAALAAGKTKYTASAGLLELRQAQGRQRSQLHSRPHQRQLRGQTLLLQRHPRHLRPGR